MRDAEDMTPAHGDTTGPTRPAPSALPGTGEDLTVGATAALVGVSVRALHHWDAIGLARPSGRSWAGYRLYQADDVTRLHRVLVYREAGLPLAQIVELLDDPTIDTAAHLENQRERLTERISHLARMVRAVDTLLARTRADGTHEKETTMSTPLTPAEQAKILGTDWDPAYAEEAETRWGHTDDWAESARRQATMTAADWERARDQTEALEAELAAAMAAGVAPGSERAAELAERHRADLGRWFEVTHAKQVLIARGYTDDPRFTAHYDSRREGLAVWLRAVIEANAAAHGIDVEAAICWE